MNLGKNLSRIRLSQVKQLSETEPNNQRPWKENKPKQFNYGLIAITVFSSAHFRLMRDVATQNNNNNNRRFMALPHPANEPPQVKVMRPDLNLRLPAPPGDVGPKKLRQSPSDWAKHVRYLEFLARCVPLRMSTKLAKNRAQPRDFARASVALQPLT